ncbi:methylated-DNA--[protein]-cysteine S-methyltransferase [Clostridium sp. MB40-C1]|uniref:methylated-DNA--[protein]-cysteine S-methyltransferase n=1 Tax=Clostridium sp. MB40-C1 TaxID=3070996 RepID=UPI0027E030F1|nr:methylated-DNA--[protein]-cysteine S-methyltransferase [Clostridium sp. MB40-C1]WMJ81153.1 methylated-DNA--[protein]-cysteine S-methyltransferase [Clostridium sp. MB40-C1]
MNEYFKGKRKVFTVKVSLNGTEFQNKIWDELTKIPFGKTVTYKNMAESIGNSKAVRAVGNANGKNVLNIIVPCHRVIGSDGSLTGYGGGLWRKKWILTHEEKWK